jgi:hypothetical protein
MSDTATEIATLELTADADYGEIQSIIGALETVSTIDVETNQDSTYTITRSQE